MIFKPIEYIRTRDESILLSCDLRVDVGRLNNPKTGDFDHHQSGGAGSRPNGVPYASFGLVWKYYGQKICESDELSELVDKTLVQIIDADDNGQNLFSSKIPDVLPFTVDKIVDLMMPSWKLNPTDDEVNIKFEQALDFASETLNLVIKNLQDKLDAKDIVQSAIKSAKDHRLIIFERHVPWQSEIIENAPEALFIVQPAWPKHGDWVVSTINKGLNTFENRKDLPASWAGKNDQELVDITKVADAKFCHPALFMAVASSKVGALNLAKLALEQ